MYTLNCMFCKLQLNKAVTKKKRTLDHSSNDKQNLSDIEKEICKA